MPQKPDPRDIRRLAALQEELDTLRESSQSLAARHRQLQRKLAETQDKLLASEEVTAHHAKALSEFEAIALAGLIPHPEEPTLPAFARAAMAELERAAQARERIRELEEALAEAEAAAPAGEDEETAVTALVQENRRMADEVDALQGENRVLQSRLEDSDTRAEEERRETEEKIRAHFEDVIAGLRRREAVLEKQLVHATAQLEAAGREPIIPPERVSIMVENLLRDMQSHLPGLSVAEGEMRLKVGFGSVGEEAGFVIPTTGGEAREYEGLNEIVLRFDRVLRREER